MPPRVLPQESGDDVPDDLQPAPAAGPDVSRSKVTGGCELCGESVANLNIVYYVFSPPALKLLDLCSSEEGWIVHFFVHFFHIFLSYCRFVLHIAPCIYRFIDW